MNIFKKIFTALGPPTLSDSVFGTIRYQKVGFWEGKVQFKPLSSEIEVLIDGDATGPTEEQRRWFRIVEEKYLAALPQIIEAAMPRVREWNKELTKEKLLAELKLETISVNKCEPGRHEWDITFYSEPLEHWVNITLIEWTGKSTTIDG